MYPDLLSCSSDDAAQWAMQHPSCDVSFSFIHFYFTFSPNISSRQ